MSSIEHQNFIIRKDLEGLEVLQNPHKLPLSTFLGVLGMPGIYILILPCSYIQLFLYRKNCLHGLERIFVC